MSLNICRLYAVILSVWILAGCASTPTRSPLFPAYTGAPSAPVDLGDVPGRYYAYWGWNDGVVVVRSSRYGNFRAYGDFAHITDVWVIDRSNPLAKKAEGAYKEQILKRLSTDRLNFQERGWANSGSQALEQYTLGIADTGYKMQGVLVQPSGQQLQYKLSISYNAPMFWPAKGWLRFEFDFGATGKLWVFQPRGGANTMLLGAQVSPDLRFVKSDRVIMDLVSNRRAEMFKDFSGLESIVVDPSWKTAALLYKRDGRHWLDLTAFDPMAPWE